MKFAHFWTFFFFLFLFDPRASPTIPEATASVPVCSVCCPRVLKPLVSPLTRTWHHHLSLSQTSLCNPHLIEEATVEMAQG
jgi:hypothetical protein